MGINSKIRRNVSEITGRKRLEDKLWRIRQDADFSLVDDEDLPLNERIDNALSGIQDSFIARKNWLVAEIVCFTLLMAVVIAAIYIPASQGLISFPLEFLWFLISILYVLSLLVVFCADHYKDDSTILFWVAHANNLIEQTYVDNEIRDSVKYWTKKALKALS